MGGFVMVIYYEVKEACPCAIVNYDQWNARNDFQIDDIQLYTVLVLYTSEIYMQWSNTGFLNINFTVARLSLKLYNKHDLHKAASQLIKIDLK